MLINIIGAVCLLNYIQGGYTLHRFDQIKTDGGYVCMQNIFLQIILRFFYAYVRFLKYLDCCARFLRN